MLRRITQPVLIGSVISDALYVPAEQHTLAFLPPARRTVRDRSEHGHDGFLIDAARFEPRVRRFVERLPADGALASPLPASQLRYAW